MSGPPATFSVLLLLAAACSAAFAEPEPPSAPERHEIPAADLGRMTRGTPFVDENDDFIEDRYQGAAHHIMLFTPPHATRRIPYGSHLHPHLYLAHPPATAGDSVLIYFKCRNAAEVRVRAPDAVRDSAVPLRLLTPGTGAFVLPPQPLSESPIRLLIATDAGRWEAFVHLKPARTVSGRRP